MIIKGFQKLTLLDFPGKTACTVFTAGCNLRCPFCHNALLVTEQNDVFFSEEEIFEHLDRRKNVLDGVAVTGGEPLLQKDIERFLYEIKDKGFLVKLDTNGYHPELLKELVDEKLVDYVAMDIKNCPEKYGVTVGIENIDISKIEQTKNYLLSGAVDYEFRTTVVKELHEKEDLIKAAKWIAGAKQWYLQSFTDSGDIIGENFSAHTPAFMKEIQHLVSDFVEKVELRGI